jgi:lipoprotein-releasing system permease protein
MNLSAWVAQRISFSNQYSIASFIVKISITALALSLGIMIISNSMITGFQVEIKNKLFDFWGHAQIKSLDNNQSFEENPIKGFSAYIDSLKSDKSILNIEPFIQKAGIIKTKDNIEGIVLKSIDAKAAKTKLGAYLSEGNFDINNDTITQLIWLSEHTAARLQLKINDKLLVYFVENATLPKVRKFYVKGIYNSGLLEYDEVFAFVDYTMLAQLTNFGDSMLSGIQLRFYDATAMQTKAEGIELNILPQDQICKTIRDINPNIFDWLGLQNMNEIIILILMAIVAIVNMINMLLILILERTKMVGMLAALGASHRLIQNIFLFVSLRIIFWGLLWGNVFGFGLCLLQRYGKFIKLPQESYYVKVAPIFFDYKMIVLLNVGVVVVTLLSLLIPAQIIQKIKPVKAIQFN